jgi:Tfp pilus assembly protein PilF
MRFAKLFLAPGVLLVHATVLPGQYLLFQSQSGADGVKVHLSAPAGDSEAQTQPASFDSVPTVILNPTVLQTPDIKDLTTALLSFFPKAGAATLDLSPLLPGQHPQPTTVSTRQQFLAAMKTLGAGAQPDAAPISFAALVDYLTDLPASNPTWKQIVFTGPEPSVPAELREYSYGLLARVLASRRIRLLHFLTSEAAQSAWGEALTATGGKVFSGDPATATDTSGAAWIEVKVPEWGPTAGFRVAPVSARLESPGSDPMPARSFPWIWSSDGRPLPAPQEYAEFLQRRAQVLKASGESSAAGSAVAPDVAADLSKLLALNPYDPESLNLATDFADRSRDYAAAARYAARIAELEPANGPNFARLGFFRWQTGDTPGAEHDFLRARELQADHPQSAAILGDIRSERKDYPGAATEYQEAVRREPDRIELWLKLADVQQARGRKPEVALAIEEVLKRRPDMWDRRTQVIDYYLEAADGAQALRQVHAGIAMLPADAALVTRFALYSERLDQPKDAESLWSRVIELDHANERAYYSLAQLRARAHEWDRALAAAEAGAAAVATSARLHALRVDALNALGRIDDARRVARNAADQVPDSALFGRTAAFEDRYGKDSPRYYKSQVEAMRSANQPETAWRGPAERGLLASIREQQSETCAWFAALLASKLCGPDTTASAAAAIAIPGGTRALLFTAHGPAKSSSKTFLADFSRTISATEVGLDQKSAEQYRASLIDYFHLLAELKTMGSAAAGKTDVRLSLENNKSRQLTERVLEMLGWHSRRQNGKTVVEPVTKGEKRKHQDLASALAVDVVAMQENLQSGKEFVLEIPEERVEIFPDEGQWRSQFYPNEHYASGFLEALVRNPEMASLYSALSGLTPEVADLLATSGMKYMAEKYGRLLNEYSSCLEVSLGRVHAPGGDTAIPIWAALAGVSPDLAGKFIRALLDKDEGRLIRFYFLLSQLDYSRQRFFTVSQKRTQAFYEVFRQSSQVEGRQSLSINSATIEDLFRELPLDPQGRILFPGGPAVWMVAKNQSSSVQSTERRLNKLSRVTTPDVEDDILLRLIRTEFSDKGSRVAAWQNFLAVVRVDAARTEAGGDPLDEESALLLAEKYVANRGLYGYFAGLKALDAAHYREVLGFGEKIPALDRKKANIAAGVFQSALYLLSAAECSGRIAPAKTGALLLDFIRAMNQDASPAQVSRASLTFLGAYMDAAGADRNSPSLSEVLAPAVANQAIDAGDGHPVNPRETILKDYARVIELQRVPRLNDLLKIHGALSDLASAKGDPHASVGILTDAAAGIQDVEIPKKLKLPDSDLELLKSSQAARFTELNLEFTKEVAKKKIDPKHLRETADEYWDALAFRAVVALAGQIYAANFRPDDLLVAEDTLFLRKHQFVPWVAAGREYLKAAELEVSSDTGGSRITGGFEGISTVAGRVAASNLRDVEPTAAYISWAVLGSVRATDWSRVGQSTLRAVAVQIHAAQDWLVLAAREDRLYEAVGTATYGLLSLNRRARLLLALHSRDWNGVWSSVSVSDLFFLAGRLRAQLAKADAQSASPAIDEYLASTGIPGGTAALGPTLQHLRTRPATGMVELPPYEQVAVQSFPVYLAERVAEFKIYLVRLFAEHSLPAAALPAVAESAARAVLGDIQMTNLKDWQAVLDAYEGFDGARLKEVMGTL